MNYGTIKRTGKKMNDYFTYLQGVKTTAKVTFRNANQSTQGSRICFKAFYLANFFEPLHDMDISRPIESNLKGMGSELSQRGSIYIIADADNWPKDWSFDMRIASLTCAF
jgi:hypothetical protein